MRTVRTESSSLNTPALWHVDCQQFPPNYSRTHTGPTNVDGVARKRIAAHLWIASDKEGQTVLFRRSMGEGKPEVASY